MQEVAAEESEAPPPIRTTQARPKPLRVEPENQERLSDAKRRLGALFNVETEEGLLLNQFIEEQLETWVREKERLGARPAKKRRSEAERA